MSIITTPGKFEGELLTTKLLYEASLDGGLDPDSERSEEGIGWYGFFDDVRAWLDPSLEELSDAEWEAIPEGQAAILYAREDGFVEGAYYDTHEEAMEAWDRVRRQFIEPEFGDIAIEPAKYGKSVATYRVGYNNPKYPKIRRYHMHDALLSVVQEEDFGERNLWLVEDDGRTWTLVELDKVRAFDEYPNGGLVRIAAPREYGFPGLVGPARV